MAEQRVEAAGPEAAVDHDSQAPLTVIVVVCLAPRQTQQWELQLQDRVEVYRALKVDPKVARRERFAKQGARTTGLFASKRPGAKAGY